MKPLDQKLIKLVLSDPEYLQNIRYKYNLDKLLPSENILLTITFVTRFGKKPMHFFGVIGTVMFVLGFGIFGFIVIEKLLAMSNNVQAKNIADMSIFYIALTSMIIGVQLFLAGFISEMISRASNDRNNYQIEKEV